MELYTLGIAIHVRVRTGTRVPMVRVPGTRMHVYGHTYTCTVHVYSSDVPKTSKKALKEQLWFFYRTVALQKKGVSLY